MRIDQKPLVKDLVKDDHWNASKVVRESFAKAIFFSRKTATERLRERWAKVSRMINHVFAKDRMTERLRERRAKDSRKITLFSRRMVVLFRKNIDQCSYIVTGNWASDWCFLECIYGTLENPRFGEATYREPGDPLSWGGAASAACGQHTGILVDAFREVCRWPNPTPFLVIYDLFS